MLSSLFLSVFVSSSFQLACTSSSAPPVLFVSPSMLLSTAVSSISPGPTLRVSLENSKLPSLAFLLSSPELPWRVILSKLSVLASFFLSKHVEHTVRQWTLHAGGRGRAQQEASLSSLTGSSPPGNDAGFPAPPPGSSGLQFIEEIHGVHAVCFSLFSASVNSREKVGGKGELVEDASRTRHGRETLLIEATSNVALAKKGKWKKATTEAKGGVSVRVYSHSSFAESLELGKDMDELETGDAPGATRFTEEYSAFGGPEAASRDRGHTGDEARRQADDAVMPESEELLLACLEASSRSRELAARLFEYRGRPTAADTSLSEGQKWGRGDNKGKTREREEGSEEGMGRVVAQAGINAAVYVFALGVSMLSLYPYLVSRNNTGKEAKRSTDVDQEEEGNEGQGGVSIAAEESSDAGEDDIEAAPLFGSEAKETGSEALVEEEKKERLEFCVLLREFSDQMQQLLTLLENSAKARKKRGIGCGEEFASLAAEVLSKTARTVSRLLFAGGSGFGGGFLRSIGKSLWKELCVFIAAEDLDAVVDVFTECDTSLDETRREGEQGDADEGNVENEMAPAKKLKTCSHTVEAEKKTEDCEAPIKFPKARDSRAGHEREKEERENKRKGSGSCPGTSCGDGPEPPETPVDDPHSARPKSEDENSRRGEEDSAGSDDDDDDDDDRFSVELGVDETYRALLDEDGDALPGELQHFLAPSSSYLSVRICSEPSAKIVRSTLLKVHRRLPVRSRSQVSTLLLINSSEPTLLARRNRGYTTKHIIYSCGCGPWM